MTAPCSLCGGGGRYRPEGCAPWCADLVLVRRPNPPEMVRVLGKTSEWWVVPQ